MEGAISAPGTLAPSYPRIGNADRRKHSRCATVLQIARLTSATHEELCIVRDVSSGGIRAEVYVSLSLDEAVEVEFKNGLRMRGKVAWANGEMTGIAFDTKTSIHSILSGSIDNADGYRLRKPRVRASGRARLIYDQHDIDVRLRDASQAGFKIEVDEYLEQGKECEVDAPGIGRRHGRIKWCQDGHAGIMLYQPMFYRDFANWRRTQQPGISPPAGFATGLACASDR